MKRKLLKAALVCLLLFIWGHSLSSGEASREESDYVLDVTLDYFAWLPGSSFLDFASIRKLAHLTEFAALGMVLSGLWLPLKKRWPLWVLACGCAAGAVDEGIQLFSPGRSAQVSDVLLDTAGVGAGVAVYVILKLIDIRLQMSDIS